MCIRDSFSIVPAGEGDGLKVLNPNRKVKWQRGKSYPIRWSYSGVCGPEVKISLLRKGVLFKTLARRVAIGQNGIGKWRWNIRPHIKIGSEFLVRVESLTNSSCVDRSDKPFALVP